MQCLVMTLNTVYCRLEKLPHNPRVSARLKCAFFTCPLVYRVECEGFAGNDSKKKKRGLYEYLC
jgi:hypothetical protein